jgi:hypothetical protein
VTAIAGDPVKNSSFYARSGLDFKKMRSIDTSVDLQVCCRDETRSSWHPDFLSLKKCIGRSVWLFAKRPSDRPRPLLNTRRDVASIVPPALACGLMVDTLFFIRPASGMLKIVLTAALRIRRGTRR